MGHTAEFKIYKKLGEFRFESQLQGLAVGAYLTLQIMGYFSWFVIIIAVIVFAAWADHADKRLKIIVHEFLEEMKVYHVSMSTLKFSERDEKKINNIIRDAIFEVLEKVANDELEDVKIWIIETENRSNFPDYLIERIEQSVKNAYKEIKDQYS